ncbi:lipopolysaccharide biosynthesis protein, partial [Psychrobacter celer]|uniref:lipopolysaccharide biosynthesis protein n=1 Tax=Psychrobacter celer TaxID=306572 RepID=UPI003FD4ED26
MSKSFKNVLLLLGGTGLAQAFTILISPILTRLYSPEAYGYLGLILSISSILATSVHLRLNLAISLSENKEIAKLTMISAIVSSMFLSSLFSILVYFYLINFKQEFPSYIVYFIFLFSLLNSTIDVFNYWQSYRNRFKQTATVNIVRAIVVGMAQILLGYYFESFGLILGFAIGGMTAVILYTIEYFKHKDHYILNKFTLNSYKHTIIRNKSFVMFSMPQGLMASASLNIVPIVLGFYFSAAIAGFYWLAYRLLLAPISLLGGAYKQVFHVYYTSKNYTYDEKINKAKQHTLIYTIIFLPSAIITFYIAEPVFTFVYGQEWALAGRFASWLFVCFGADIGKVPAVSLIHASQKHKLFLKYEGVLFVCRVLVIVLFAKIGNSENAVIAFSILNFLFSISLIYIVLYKMKINT